MTHRAALSRAACIAVSVTAATCLAGLPVAAKVGTPGLAWFAGHYDRIGRDGDSPPRRFHDSVTLSFRGDRLDMTDCDGRRMQLVHDPSFDYADRLVGVFGNAPVDCQFRNNGANRPVLTCESSDGAAFTLWPLPEKVGAAKGSCAP